MKYRRAVQDDNRAILNLLKSIAMPGQVEVSYCREPDYFTAEKVLGDYSESIVAISGDDIVGIAERSERELYVNGEESAVGYIGALRLREDVRNGTCLFKGYRKLREFHEESTRVQAYLTTIIEDNQTARDILTSGRAGLPHYEDIGLVETFALMLNRRKGFPQRAGITITTADVVPFEELQSFWKLSGKTKQFFPVLSEEDFSTERLKGMTLGDIFVALKDGEIVGTLAGWDQNSYKQSLIQQYHGYMKLFLPVINAALRLGGYNALPKAGSTMKLLYGALFLVKDDNQDVAKALIETLYCAYQKSDFESILIGSHESYPLRDVIHKYSTVTYRSRLYLAYWEDGRPFSESLNRNLPIHVDIATL